MKNISILIVLFGLLTGRVNAQDTIRLSFQEAVQIGLTKNVNYQRLQNQQEVLRIERLNAQLSHLPRINVNSNAFQQVGQQFQQVEGELIVTNQINNSLSGGLNVTLPIFNGIRRINQTQAGRFFERAGENEIERGKQEMMFNVAQQYLQILLDEELYKIALENLENQKTQLAQIEGFVEAGLRTLSDQYNQQSEVARLETVALDAKIQWETDLWTLAETLQLEPNQVPELEPVVLDNEESELLQLPLEELYATAQAERSDFRQQQLLENANKRMNAVSRSFMYPQLNAFFNYNTFATSLDNRGITEQFTMIYPVRTVGFQLNIPVFNNFDNRAFLARTRMEYKNQQLETYAMERRINQETKLAYENYKAALRRESATSVQLAAAEEAQKAISERFRLGVSNFVDLAQANQQLVTAQSDYAQALFTIYFQEILLRYAMGILQVNTADPAS